jgi:hypothetical protein
MLPNVKQRLWIALALVLGGLMLLSVAGLVAPSDGSTGLVVLEARIGPAAGVALVAVAALPAVALGVVAAAAGNALGGVFTVAGAIAFLGVAGGSTSGWLWRSALPGSYWLLAVEMLLWAGGLIGVMAAIQQGRPWVRQRMPASLRSDQPSHPSPLRWPSQSGLLGGVIAAVLGGVAANLLLRSTDMGQITGGLILAFTLAGLIARTTCPKASPTPILLSPCLTGLAGYAYLAVSYVTTDQVLAAWYAGQLLNLGLALPIHYASAGVMGAAMGVGFAQGLEQIHQEAVAETVGPEVARPNDDAAQKAH